jgi:hypothetical protein
MVQYLNVPDPVEKRFSEWDREHVVVEAAEEGFVEPDGAPVRGFAGLVWWQGVPVPEDAYEELSHRMTNGWLAA